MIKELLIFGMLFTGTINTLSKKWQNEQKSIGIDGKTELFHFPWTQTLIMYCGEALCMFAFFGTLYAERKTALTAAEQHEINQTEVALLIKQDGEENLPRSKLIPFYFLLVSLLDLAGTTLGGIGLLFTYASVFQMLRGSIIIFSGMLRVFILKKKLLSNQWIAIGITTCGLVMVGWSSLLDESGAYTPSQLLFGNGLIVAGQFAGAVQFIAEEVFLKKYNFQPLLVVGTEGCWGIVVMCSVVLPVLYYIPTATSKHYENALDAAVLIGHNHVLLGLVLLYWLSIAFYNFCGLSVAKRLTSVHRTFIDASRTIIVWCVQITLYYATEGKAGEPWGKHSFLQLGGFVLLVIGTFIYNDVHIALYKKFRMRKRRSAQFDLKNKSSIQS